MRLEEAWKLRELVLERLRDKEAKLLNDTPNAKPIKTVVGRRPKPLVDLRPCALPGAKGQRREVWTVYYKNEDAYDRFDYLLVSPEMAREWRVARTRVLASDHHPIIATFSGRDE